MAAASRGSSITCLPQLRLWPVRGGPREAHLSAQQPSSRQEARLPQPHEHRRWPRRPEGSPRQGPPPSVGLIWRIRERSVVARVSRDGRRVRAGVLWCNCLFDPEASPPRVAFAIGRAIGPSVVRNRVRRRLRAALAAAALPPGNYLVGARPDVAARSFDELTRDVTALVASAAALAARAAATPQQSTNTRSIDPGSWSGS